MDEPEGWFWCLRHERVEPAATACPPDQRLGPYPTSDAAAHWKDTATARNEEWDREDEA